MSTQLHLPVSHLVLLASFCAALWTGCSASSGGSGFEEEVVDPGAGGFAGGANVTGGAPSGGVVATGGESVGGAGGGTGGPAPGQPNFASTCCSPGPHVPFGSAPAYRFGLLPTAPDRTAKVAAAYTTWKSQHLRQGCGVGRYYVKANSTFSERVTVSEAMGYGMMISAYMAGADPEAQQIFDGLLAFVRDYPSQYNPRLMAYAIEGDGVTSCFIPNDGKSAATDGDLDIAYALLLADRQWGSCGAVNYRQLAQEWLTAINDSMVERGQLLKLGDWVGQYSNEYNGTLRPSDFMPGHLTGFSALTGSPVWAAVDAFSYQVIDSVQTQYSPSAGLVPDFIVGSFDAPRPASGGWLEGPNDGAYHYNAARVPFRIGVHYLMTGDARAKAFLDRLNGWLIPQGAPESILESYALDGSHIGGNFTSLAFAAPFGVGLLASNDAPSVEATFQYLASENQNSYYEDTLNLLALIAMSGNWWAPEAIGCAD